MLTRLLDSSRPGVTVALVTIAGLGPVSIASGQEPTLQRPFVSTITIQPDTVWFCGSMYPGATAADYAWVRRSREWKRLAGATRAPCSGADSRYDDRDTLPIGGRMTLLRVKPKAISGADVSRRAYLTLLDSVTGRRIDLKPRIDSSHLRLIDPGYELYFDTLTTAVGAVAITDSVLWIGLAGGFAEGSGELGGLFRVDRRTGSYELIIDERLASHSISSLARSGNWLWVGTQRPAEYGPFGDAGLLRMDLRSRAWRAYNDSVSPLPDALIQTARTDGRILAVATELGLAIAELRDRGAPVPAGEDEAVTQWISRFFVPAFAGDSMVFDLDAKPLAGVSESRGLILQRFGQPGRERALHDALSNVSAERLDQAAYATTVEEVGEALADTTLIPTLVSMLSTVGEGQLVAALALGKLGSRVPKDAITAVRGAFMALDSASVDAANRVEYSRPLLGKALIGLGDSTPVRWARSALEAAVRSQSPGTRAAERERESRIVSASQILAAARDRVGLTLLMGVAPVAGERAKESIARQLAAYDEPMAWGALVAFGRGRQLPTRAVLDVLTPSALRDPTVATRVQDLIAESLRDSAGYTGFRAVYAIERLRLIGFAPTLVRNLEPGRIRDADFAEWTVRALVTMTGRGDAPVYSDPLPPRSVFDWWQTWLSAAGGKPVLVSEDIGRRALNEWSARFHAIRPEG